MSLPSIAALAIAKNERARLDDWISPLREADDIFILDTGSTDGTNVVAHQFGVCVFAEASRGLSERFRFDRARNELLVHVEDKKSFDYVFWVDLDEIAESNWREKFNLSIKRYGDQEVFSTTRIWGSLAYERPTIHKLSTSWGWRRPVHEELIFRDRQEYSPAPTGIEVRHDQDPGKDRSQYLPLMKLACEEDPEDTQIAFWYARELMYHHNYRESLAAFRTFIAMENAWVIEKMQALLHMADIYSTISPHTVMRRRAMENAVAIAPWRREPLLAMARYYRENGERATAQAYARQALSIPHTMRPQDYLSAENTWNDDLIREESSLA